MVWLSHVRHFRLFSHPTVSIGTSPNSAVSASMPALPIPAARLAQTLTALNQDEHDRIANASSSTSSSSSAPYAECSSSLHIASQHRRDNRWNDILTFDHSLLPGDYLNAALIPAYPNDGVAEQSYVASQAPLPHTLSVFYDHIIRQRVRLIVNLTPFRERGRTKADEYWPMKETEEFNVPCDSPSSTKYVVRQVRPPVKLDQTLEATRYDLGVFDQKTAASPYEVSVLHVTAWADFGDFPEEIFAHLLQLIQENQARDSHNSPSPIWVHCSAGVGRSGTVIASLMARDLGSSIRPALGIKTKLSTPSLLVEASLLGTQKLIDHTRRYRPRMVQTDEQVGMVAAVVGAQLQQHKSDNS